MKSKILVFIKKLFHIKNVALLLLLFSTNFRVLSQCVLPTISSVKANPATICWTPDVSTTLTVTGELGSADHWAWYEGSCGGTSIGTGPSITHHIEIPNTYTYYVRGEGGCVPAGGTCQSVSVMIYEGFTASITGGDMFACEHTTLTTSTSNVSNPTFAWYKDDNPIEGETTSALVVTQAGKYNVEVTNVTTGCKKLSDPFTVISVSSMPSNRTVYADRSTVCQGTRVNIIINNSESGVYYRLRNDNGDVNIGDPVSGINGVNIFLPVDNLTETTTFNVLASKGNCTLEMADKPTVTVGIIEPSITSATAVPATICNGASTTLSVNGSLGCADHWAWYEYSCGGTLRGTGQSLVLTPYPGTRNYYVRAEGGSAGTGGTCTKVTVTVNNWPSASIIGGEQNACVSTTLTASTDAINPIYAWYKDEVLIPDQTNSTLVATQTGSYTVKVTNGTTGCERTSNAFPILSVSSMPSNKTIFADPSTGCPGTRVNIGINNSESGVLYRLRNDNGNVFIGDPLSGINGVTIYILAGNLTETSTFNVLAIKDHCTLEMADKPTVTISSTEPSISDVKAVPAVICNGTSTTLTVSGDLGCANHWAWYEFSCGGTPKGTGPSVTLYPDPGTHTYFVRAEGGSAGTGGTCSSTTVMVNESHTASIIGGEHNACVSTTLTATTDATSPGYAWYKDGGLIADQTNSTLVVTQTGNYAVKVTNGTTGCEKTSSAFAVNSVSSMPSNKTVFANPSTVCSGTKVNIGIADTENGVLYQLRNDNGDVNIGIPVSGSKGSTILISAGTLTETTTFNVLATKGNCTREMDDKPTVTVNNTAPSITEVTAIPSAICPGTSTTLTVSGSLGSASAWIWYSGSCGGTMEGTGPSITVSPTETTTYYVRGEGGCTTPGGICNDVTVTVNSSLNPTVTIVSDDADNNICYQTRVNFTATPANTGGGTVSYTWFLNNITWPSWNQQEWSYGDFENGDVIRCEITVTGGTCLTATTAVSNEIIIKVYDPTIEPSVSIISDAPDNKNCDGTLVKFTATSSDTGGGTVSYQWKYNDRSIGSDQNSYWSDELINGDKVSCEITVRGAACFNLKTASSNVIVTSVKATPAPPNVGTITQPTCSSATGSVALSGLPSPGDWMITGTGGTGTVTKTGKKPTETITGLSAGTTYTFTVTNGSGCTSKPSGDVVIDPQPQTPVAPAVGPQSFCGSATADNLPHGNGIYTYQWYHELTKGEPLPGKTKLSTGNYYVSQISGGCESSRTMVKVTINDLPKEYKVSGGGTYCTGGPGLTVKLSDSALGVNYQLYLNGLPVAGAIIPGTGSALNFINQIQEGTYTVKAVNAITGCEAIMNDKAVITVSEIPTATGITYDKSTSGNCKNSGSATIVSCSCTPGGKYTSAPAGLNINSSTGTINFPKSDPGTYTVTYTVSNTCGTAKTSTTVTVTKCDTKSAVITNDGSAVTDITPDANKLIVYPNPSNGQVHFEFSTILDGKVTIDLFNTQGKLLWNIFEGNVLAGEQRSVIFNEALPTGTYIYRMNAADGVKTGKLIIIVQ